MAMASFVAAAWPSRAESLPPAAETGECSLEGAVPATVAAVDEDFELLLDDGRRAALAGLDFPPPEMAELRAAIRSRLSSWLAGRDIFLDAFASTLDRWGRAPARIYASPAEGGASAPLTSVAAALLSAGEARFRPDPTAAACAKAYLAARGPGARFGRRTLVTAGVPPDRRLGARRGGRSEAAQGNDCRRRRDPLGRRVAARLLP